MREKFSLKNVKEFRSHCSAILLSSGTFTIYRGQQHCVLLAKCTSIWGESVNRKALHFGVISYMAVMVGAIILYAVQSNAHQMQAIVEGACSGPRSALSEVPIIYCYLCVKLLLVRRTSVTYGHFISFCRQLI